MRIRYYAILALATGLPAVNATGQVPAPADHVILISIDGLRPEFYLDDTWPAPVLQQMAQEGAHAGALRGVFPSVTYPTHTTMITGALPARHGIYYNSPFEPGGQTGRWYWEYDSIRVHTLWEVARGEGLRTASIFWPVTVRAPIDRNVPEVWSLDSDISMTDVLRDMSTPAGILDELERQATGRLVMYDSTGEFVSFDHSWWDPRRVAMAEYLLGTQRPNFMALHIIATDEAQHDYGRSGVEVRKAVAGADRSVGRLVEAAERAGLLERTAFVIVGDHGFVDVSTQIAPNVWLAEAGLMEARDDRGDWRAVFHTAGGSAFLHLRDPNDSNTIARIRDIIAGLPARVRSLFRIVERGELDALGADPRVPFALAAAQGVNFTLRPEGEAIQSASGGSHGFLPDFHPDIHSGFVAWGAGVRPGAVAPHMGMEDIAPFVARLLDLEFEAPDGVFRPGLLARRRDP